MNESIEPLLSANTEYRQDLDQRTRQFKMIPLGAVRAVEFLPEVTSEYDLRIDVAHRRDTGTVVLTDRDSRILTDVVSKKMSKLRHSDVEALESDSNGKSDGDGDGKTATGSRKGSASASELCDEYVVPFFVRADNRQNRIMWILGLDIMFSRRGMGSFERKHLARLATLYELYHTEKQYVMRLDELIVQVRLPLDGEDVLGDSDLALVFGNIDKVLDVSQSVLNSMTSRFEQRWDADKSLIGDVWLQHIDSLNVYKAHSVSYIAAMQVIKRLQQENSRFREFCRARPGQLESSLIAPVQRVPRYLMLMRELLAKTPRAHPDYANVAEVVSRIEKLANAVDQSVRDHESRTGIAEISHQLRDLPPKLLTRPGLVFVRQGILRKVTTRRTVPTLLLLFNDFLVYAHHELVGNQWVSDVKQKRAGRQPECVPLVAHKRAGFPRHCRAAVHVAARSRGHRERQERLLHCLAAQNVPHAGVVVGREGQVDE